ncbi:MAG: fused MFS/spermidine synthase [Anaerolineae bacterium]|nr:fused MFS/spermidine synthase [Anaerolineae bacterium]
MTLAGPPADEVVLQRPASLVFASSAAIMVLELVVGRIAASYVGWSLYTWSVVISALLAGISLGNGLGGRLADRWASRHLLGALLALAGLISLGILAVGHFEALIMGQDISRASLPLLLGLGVLAVLLFTLPCIVLGTISPLVVKLCLGDLRQAGRTVGRIYAAGSLGSIAGTFLTGFWLISTFGTQAVIWGVGMLLILLGAGIWLGRRRGWLGLTLLVMAGCSAMAGSGGWLDGPCTRESDYYCIRVVDETTGNDTLRVLYLNRLVHSYSSLKDPTRLHYEYERRFADAAAYQSRRLGDLRALLIGGGGYTFPRYFAVAHPDSQMDVVEIDPEVTQVAYDLLGLPRDTEVVTYNQDARMLLREAPPPGDNPRYDLIYGDAFSDFSVPYHLTTLEFNQQVRSWLSDEGLYVANIIDGPPGHFLRAYLRTLRKVYRHVRPVMDLPAWHRMPRSTIVILASDAPLDLDLVRTVAPEMAEELLDDPAVDVLLAEGRQVVLTDRYVPVDLMLFPVFWNQLPK